jgi:hypothetical protein
MVVARRVARVKTRWVLVLLGLVGCAGPPPHELDPERILAEEPLQGPDGTPLAPFPVIVFGLGFNRSEFELSRDCEAAGGRLPQSRETWYGPAPEPEPWACLDLPAPGVGSGRFRRVSARFTHQRSCELAFSGMLMDPDVALGALVAKYGPPAARDQRTPCQESYLYDFAHESLTVAWTWRDEGHVLATIVLVQTCKDATLTYTVLAPRLGSVR